MIRHIKNKNNKNPKKVRRVLTHKNKGNIASLLLGQMFLMVVIIYAVFNMKLSLLNTVFNYIDDSLTTSLLGGALVNVEDYGKSHQLIIYSEDAYTDIAGNNQYNGWTKTEADILLSEMNIGSNVSLNYSDLSHKKGLNINRRRGEAVAGGTKWNKDAYLRRSLSAFTQNLKYNTTNGKTGEKENLNILADKNSTIELQNSNNMYISSDLLKNTFLGAYIISQGNKKDIEITRFDIYNLYKANLAEKHVYQSEFFTVTGKNSLNWNTIGGYKMDNEDNFKTVFEPKGSSVSSEAMIEYDRKHQNWLRDKAVADAATATTPTQSLICYTDAEVTYQGDYDNSKVKFDYFYSSDGKRFNSSSGALVNADKVVAGQEAPISGYSIYSYKSSNSEFNYSGGTTYAYKDETATTSSNGAKSSIVIQDGKMDGASIKNTSLYAEITFDISIFPSGWDNIWGDLATKRVTVARLIDIELKNK